MPDLTIPPEVRALANELAQPKPMRRGSVSERYVKCNKPGCPCAEHPEARHGPYYSVSRVVGGITKSRWLTAEQVGQVREQVQAAQQFRKQLKAYWQACEQWADARLDATEAISQEGAKKGASKRRSQPRSRRKSTPS
jgi:hypothetical protein